LELTEELPASEARKDTALSGEGSALVDEPRAAAAFWPELVVLRDGSEVLIRPIEAEDKEALSRGFDALSPESRYRRFFTPMPRLSPRLLAYLTEVDHESHEALLAEGRDDHEPVGVARYVRLKDEPDAAEVAVAVVDHWQGRGAATELLNRLTERARASGIQRFRATCLAENRDALDVLEGLGAQRRDVSEGVAHLDIELAGMTEPGPVRSALRRAASGALTFRHPIGPREDSAAERAQEAGSRVVGS
jgi:RimJ/RimL family protein N-acetyltransferase